MEERYKQTIRELTGRNVVAFLSQAHVEPDITIEISSSTDRFLASVR
jgi:hypothetical protein